MTRLEHGQIRPRRSLLQALAVGLDPDRPKVLAAQLVEAAVADLVPESDRWRRYRQHRLEREMILRGDVPMPADVTRRLQLHRAADTVRAQAMAVLHRPGALDDADALDQALALLERSQVLRDQAGPAMSFRIGKVRLTVGMGP